jgi:hypothetical protein
MQTLEIAPPALELGRIPLDTLIPPNALSNEQYHAADGYSSTKLKPFSQTPWHAYWDQTHPSCPTETMQRGTMLHQALLEPQLFHKTHALAPTFTGLGKKAKDQAVSDANPGITLISQSTATLLTQGCMAVAAHKQAKAHITHPNRVTEHSIFWHDKPTGLLLKARLDLFIPHPNIIVVADLKSAADASLNGFSRQAANLQYHLSAAMHIDGLSQVYPNHQIVWCWIAVEMATQQCAVYTMSPADLAKGRTAYRSAVQSLKTCLTTNQWPGYQHDGIAQPLNLPKWA